MMKHVYACLIFLASAFCIASACRAQADDLMIVEYQDNDGGSGWAIKIYNPTGATINLSGYSVAGWNNGNTSSSGCAQLPNFNLAPGASYTISNGLVTCCGGGSPCTVDFQTNITGTNSNDVIALLSGGCTTANQNKNTAVHVDMVGNHAGTSLRIDGDSDGLFKNRLIRNAGNCQRYTRLDGANFNQTDGSSTAGWALNNTAANNHTGWTVNAPTCPTAGVGGTGQYAGLDVDTCTADAGPDQSICVSTITLSGTALCDGTASTGTWAFVSGPSTPILNGTTGGVLGMTANGNYEFEFCADATGCDEGECDTMIVDVGGPTVSAGSNQTICTGESATLDGTTGLTTYAWTPTASLNNAAIEDPVATPTTTTTYTLTGTDIGGCSNSATVTVTVTSAPTATATNTGPYCVNETIQLSTPDAGSTATYAWTGPNSFSSALREPTITSAAASDAGTYTVTVSVGTCTNTSSTSVTVDPAPTVSAGADQSICSGETATLDGTVGLTTYAWTPTTSLSNAAIRNPDATPSATTTYTLTGTDASGCTNSAAVTVTVNPAPTVSAGANQTICTGQTAKLDGSAGLNTYVWTPAASLNNSVIEDPDATPANTTTYTLTGTDANGCSNSASVTVTVTGLPPANPTNTGPYCENDQIELMTPDAGATATYAWTGPNGFTDNVREPTIATATPVNGGVYTVTVSLGTCTNSASTTVTVNPSPTVSAGANQSVCSGESANLTGTPGLTTYAWTPTATLNNTAIQNPTATPSVTTTYTLTGTDANGCTNSATVTVTVNPAPTVSAGANQTICTGQTATLDGTTGLATYAWTPAASLNNSAIEDPDASPANTTTYTLTGTDANGCSNSASVTVTVTGLPPANPTNTGPYCENDQIELMTPDAGATATYAWTGPNGFTDNVREPTIVTATSANGGIYTVTVSLGTCTNSALTTVTVNPSPTVSAGANQSVCSGESANLTGTPGLTTYAWTPTATLNNTAIQNPTATPSVTTTYTLTGTDANGCTNSATVTVTVNPAPTVSAGANQTICTGQTATLDGTTGLATYAWTPAASLNNPAIEDPDATPANTTTYTLTATDANGCSNSASVTVTVTGLPPANPTNTGPYCENDQIELSTPDAGATATFAWTGPNGFTDNVREPTFVTATSANGGIYTVTVSLGTCTNTGTTTVTVNALPTPTANNTGPYCEGENIQLNGGGGVNYQWSGPGGFNIGLQNPVRPAATPAQSGIYTVTATDANGCSNTATTNVTVEAAPAAAADNDGPYCVGDIINLTSSGGGTYAWSGPLGFTSADQNPTINSAAVNMSGVYTVTVTGAAPASCTASASTTVTVQNSPTLAADAGPDDQICAPSNDYALNGVIGGGVGNGIWTIVSQPAGANASLSANTGAVDDLNIDGDYVFRFTANPAGCGTGDDDEVTITRFPQPTATASNTGPYCEGDDIELSATGGTNFAWTGPVGFNSNQQNSTRANASTQMSGVYTVTVIDANSCQNTANTTVDVVAAPLATATNNGPYCVGQMIELEATGGGTYEWNGPLGFVSTDQNPTIANAAINMSGTYSVTVTGSAPTNCTSTASTSVTVQTAPALTADAGPDNAICEPNSTYALNGVITGGTGTGTWTLVSQPAGANANLDALTGAVSLMDENGNYVFQFDADPGACGTGDDDQVTITRSPQPTATAQNNGPFCAGAEIQLEATGGIAFAWTGPGGYTSGDQNATRASALLADAGAYVVTVTDGNGCENTATTDVVVEQCEIELRCGETYTQNFDALVSANDCFNDMPFASNSTIPGWHATNVTGTYRFRASDGNCNTGGLYSYGQDGSADRALGSLNSGSNQSVFGAEFRNATGTVITDLIIEYTGEQWRRGSNGTPPFTPEPDTLRFQYSTNANAVDDAGATWTDFNPLDFLSPTLAPNNSALDGNNTANQSAVTGIVNGLNIPDGAIFWIRWIVVNIGGQDDGLAVDDFRITPNTVPQPSSIAPGPGVPPGEDFACEDTAFTLIAQPPPPQNVEYQWYDEAGTLITFGLGPQGSSLTRSEKQGTYKYYVKSINTVTGCESALDSTVIEIDVHIPPFRPTFVSGPENLCSISGSEAYTVNNPGGTGLTDVSNDWTVAAPGAFIPTFAPNPANCFSGDDCSTTADWTGVTGGNYLLTVTPENACGTGPALDVNVLVEDDPQVTLDGLDPAYCITDNAPVALIGTPMGGTFTGPGVTGATFTPSAAGPIAQNTTITITYEFDAGVCGIKQASQDVDLVVEPILAINGLDGEYCFDDNTNYDLVGTPVGGTFSGPGVNGTQFNPSNANVGNNLITYEFTEATCGVFTIQQGTNVREPVSPNFTGLDGPYCVTQTDPVQLTGTPAGGTFNGAGILNPNNQFVPAVAGPGTHPVRYEINDGVCGVRGFTENVVVSPEPVPEIQGLASPYCPRDETTYQFTGLPLGDIVAGTFAGPGMTGNSFSPQSAGQGLHTITYSGNQGGCEFSVDSTIQVLDSLVILPIIRGARCFGEPNASATVIVLSGRSPYVYQWSNNEVGPSISGVAAGDYTLTITEEGGAGCSHAYTFNLPQPEELDIINERIGDESCPGENDGEILIQMYGGTMPYTYFWSNGTRIQDIDNLPPNDYCVNVWDARGCRLTECFTVQPAPEINASFVSVLSPSCFGAEDGAMEATATGGRPPYDIRWNNNVVGPTIAGLGQGVYCATVRDDRACQTTICTTLVATERVSIDLDDLKDVSCFGENDGEILVDVSGGTSPYSYEWAGNVANPNREDQIGLAAGFYSLTATDASGCQAEKLVEITEPDELVSEIILTRDLRCADDASGIIDLDVSGGTPNYDYEWILDNTVFSTNQDIFNGAPGNYQVIVTDQNGCTTAEIAQLNAPEPLELEDQIVTNVSCAGLSDGEIFVDADGGNAPYGFNWSNGATEAVVTGLKADAYCLTVNDQSGCFTDTCFTVREPAELNINLVEKTDVACNGESTGELLVEATGGTPNYEYFWNPGETTTGLTDVPAGIYTVLVTDDKGCETTRTFEIAQPGTQIEIEVANVSPVLCYGATGAISVNVFGGAGGYQYEWTKDGAFFSNARNLGALDGGEYCMTATDANGCFATICQTLDAPDERLNVDVVEIEDVSCFGARDGRAVAEASGGTEPTEIRWLHNQNPNPVAQNLHAGGYVVMATDANGCRAFAVATVVQPNELRVAKEVVSATCPGKEDGAINLEVSGGTQPYLYDWSDGSSDKNLSSVSAGAYSATITDANGCEVEIGRTYVPASGASPFLTLIRKKDVRCNGSSDGAIRVSASGGNAPYTYSWSNGFSSQNLNNLSGGAFTLTVTDAAGCETVSPAYLIDEPAPMQADVVKTDPAQCNGTATGNIFVDVSGGRQPYSYRWSPGFYFTEDLLNVPAGNYRLEVRDRNNCQTSVDAIVEQSPLLTARLITRTDESCRGAEDGAIEIEVEGGVEPYTYRWSNGATTQNLTNLSSGVYRVEVRDASNCYATLAAPVVRGPSIQIEVTANQDASCGAENTGAIFTSVSGGSRPYSYTWSHDPGINQADITSLNAGCYSLRVEDVAGCEAEKTICIDGVSPILISVSDVQQPACNGSCNGKIDLEIEGGTMPYSYKWSNGSEEDALLDVCAGAYSLTVVDANGCRGESDPVELFNPSELIFDQAPVVEDVSCAGNDDGSITLSVSGGNTPYQFLWSNGADDSAIRDLAPGNYSVTILDAVGCGFIRHFEVEGPEPIRLEAASITHVGCPNDESGAIRLEVFGGTGNIEIEWNDGSTGANLTGVGSGFYCANATDENGCVIQECFEVLSSGTGEAEIFGLEAGICIGDQPIRLTANPPGGFFSGPGISANRFDPAEAGPGQHTIRYRAIIDGCRYEAEAQAVVGFGPQIDKVIASQPSCATCANGALTIVFSQTSGTVRFTLDGGAPQITPQFRNLVPGTYEVCALDAAECKTCKTVELTSPSAKVAKSVSEQASNVHIYPNPTTGFFTMDIQSERETNVRVEILDLSGRLVYEEKRPLMVGQNSIRINASNLITGAYMVVVRVSDERKHIRLIVE